MKIKKIILFSTLLSIVTVGTISTTSCQFFPYEKTEIGDYIKNNQIEIDSPYGFTNYDSLLQKIKDKNPDCDKNILDSLSIVSIKKSEGTKGIKNFKGTLRSSILTHSLDTVFYIKNTADISDSTDLNLEIFPSYFRSSEDGAEISQTEWKNYEDNFKSLFNQLEEENKQMDSASNSDFKNLSDNEQSFYNGLRFLNLSKMFMYKFAESICNLHIQYYNYNGKKVEFTNKQLLSGDIKIDNACLKEWKNKDPITFYQSEDESEKSDIKFEDIFKFEFNDEDVLDSYYNYVSESFDGDQSEIEKAKSEIKNNNEKVKEYISNYKEKLF